MRLCSVCTKTGDIKKYSVQIFLHKVSDCCFVHRLLPTWQDMNMKYSYLKRNRIRV